MTASPTDLSYVKMWQAISWSTATQASVTVAERFHERAAEPCGERASGVVSKRAPHIIGLHVAR